MYSSGFFLFSFVCFSFDISKSGMYTQKDMDLLSILSVILAYHVFLNALVYCNFRKV